MKKITLLILTVVALFSCKKEEQNSPERDASAMNLTINVNRALSKAVEDGHPGNNADKISPKILSVTVLSYNNAGVELGATDLRPEEIKLAIWGSYQTNQSGTWTPVSTSVKPTGVKIGLPKGTTHVDVVVNRAPLSEYNAETNINYFNYRDNKDGLNGNYSYGDDNFDRVILATADYGKGAPLANRVAGITTPTYNMDFSVKPYLTRMEVHGGINVAPEEDWTDGYGNMWRTMTVTEYETAASVIPDGDGKYPLGAVKGTPANGFDQNKVYIPQYYWFRNGSNMDDPVDRNGNNSHENTNSISPNGSGWIKQPHYDGAAANQVKWLPNRYYAVDVESIFINNIKVKGAERTPYMHPWPGSESTALWPNWYKAFHSGGWHSSGSSMGNTFLCTGNMWDRISEANDATNGYTEVAIPAINGESKMKIITGKAKPTTGKSVYYDSANSRNIGIATNKAAAYIIYPQVKKTSTGDTESAKLRHELPHIILKVKVYKDAAQYAAGTYATGKEFITLSLFSDGALGTGNYITDFTGGNIYRFNLNDLLYTFVGDVPVPGGKPTDDKDPIDPVEPDPEMPESELIMTVKILEWAIQNIFPVV